MRCLETILDENKPLNVSEGAILDKTKNETFSTIASLSKILKRDLSPQNVVFETTRTIFIFCVELSFSQPLAKPYTVNNVTA